jgi:hypothetical protein
MRSNCAQALEMVEVILGKDSSDVAYVIDDIALAFLHVRSCISCRASLSPEEHSTFVSRVLLEKE